MGESSHFESCPTLVLNADYRPLSYYPLSLWSWQDAVKAVFMDRVNIVSEYADAVVHSPSFHMKLPSVIALKEYVQPKARPAFTRFNVFLRDRWSCQYCGDKFKTPELTFDHVIPRSRGGQTNWENIVTACQECNLLKGSYLPQECRNVDIRRECRVCRAHRCIGAMAGWDSAPPRAKDGAHSPSSIDGRSCPC